jgi:hypothetical protein
MASPQREQLIDPHYHNKIGRSTGSIVDTVVETAKVCNSLVLEYCSLCTVYIDKQVQYELISGGGRFDSLMMPSSKAFDLNDAYREEYFRHTGDSDTRMFDEDSVVESVNSRN